LMVIKAQVGNGTQPCKPFNDIVQRVSTVMTGLSYA